MFGEKVAELEALPPDAWAEARVQDELWAWHGSTSADLAAGGVFHYTTPFPERTDIVVSSDVVAAGHAEVIRREAAEPH